jgi:hypothetical protein
MIGIVTFNGLGVAYAGTGAVVAMVTTVGGCFVGEGSAGMLAGLVVGGVVSGGLDFSTRMRNRTRPPLAFDDGDEKFPLDGEKPIGNLALIHPSAGGHVCFLPAWIWGVLVAAIGSAALGVQVARTL